MDDVWCSNIDVWSYQSSHCAFLHACCSTVSIHLHEPHIRRLTPITPAHQPTNPTKHVSMWPESSEVWGSFFTVSEGGAGEGPWRPEPPGGVQPWALQQSPCPGSGGWGEERSDDVWVLTRLSEGLTNKDFSLFMQCILLTNMEHINFWAVGYCVHYHGVDKAFVRWWRWFFYW